jgi:hypothetical protein
VIEDLERSDAQEVERERVTKDHRYITQNFFLTSFQTIQETLQKVTIKKLATLTV